MNLKKNLSNPVFNALFRLEIFHFVATSNSRFYVSSQYINTNFLCQYQCLKYENKHNYEVTIFSTIFVHIPNLLLILQLSFLKVLIS